MNAEIISVGTELLLGDIVNTNARYLSGELAKLGVNVFYKTEVGDNALRLKNAFEIAFQRSDVVITTGGLGPTADDLTKEAAAKYFNKDMILCHDSLISISEYFSKLNIEMTENNKKQAYVPEGACILHNNNGTAPGCMIDEAGKLLFMLPGPPNEAIPMFEESVRPVLQAKTNATFVSRTLRVAGLGESRMETMLKDIIDKQTNPSIAPYAKDFECLLRVTASASDTENAQKLIEPVVNEIYARLGINIYAESDEESLESVVVRLCAEKKLKLAAAESCTGGALTARLVNIPGVSEVLLESVVAYCNESKIKRLGVNPETLNTFGAVSGQTAMEMAEGAAKLCGADIGISTTGIAGPSGGTQQKPVGLAYIGVYLKGKLGFLELRLGGSRQKIRGRVAAYALDYIRREILSLTI